MMPSGPAGQHRALVVEAAHQHAARRRSPGPDVLLRHLAVLEHQLAGVGAAHAELVELLGAAEKPLKPFSIRKAVTPRAAASGSVLA